MDSGDYLKLNQFYQGRADAIKSTLYTSVTWVLGFASGVVGLVVARCFELVNGRLHITQTPLALALCVVGFLICYHALAMVSDGEAHIRMNWAISNKCANKIEGFDGLIEIDGGKKVRQIWHHMRTAIYGFVTLFSLVGASALVSVCCK
jgi:hypothetical protein